jgi:phosphatidylglycerophosphate synthase
MVGASVPPRLSGRGPTIVISGELLFDPRVLAPLLTAGDRHGVCAGVSARSVAHGIQVAICQTAVLPALVTRLRDSAASLDQVIAELGGREGRPVQLADGLFLPLASESSPAALTRALIEDLGARTAATDGYLAALLDRPVSRAVTRLVLGWPLTPNQITLVGLAVGLMGGVGLTTVSYAGRLTGVVALLVSSVLDGVDGEVARARFQQSPRGARLDLAGDYLTHVVTFVGLGVGLLRQGLPVVGMWAALALVGGVATAMVAMHALVVRPALTASGDLHGPAKSREGSGAPTLSFERLAGRDYTYVLLVLALLGHLEWFLYGAAAGSWAFVAGLLAHRDHGSGQPRRRREAEVLARMVGRPAGPRDRDRP